MLILDCLYRLDFHPWYPAFLMKTMNPVFLAFAISPLRKHQLWIIWRIAFKWKHVGPANLPVKTSRGQWGKIEAPSMSSWNSFSDISLSVSTVSSYIPFAVLAGMMLIVKKSLRHVCIPYELIHFLNLLSRNDVRGFARFGYKYHFHITSSNWDSRYVLRICRSPTFISILPDQENCHTEGRLETSQISTLLAQMIIFFKSKSSLSDEVWWYEWI